MDQKISVVGHTSVDYLFNVEKIAGPNESYPVIDYNEYYGGGAANVAAGIAKIGGNSQLISPVGPDFLGSDYESHLLKLGVDLSLIYIIEGEKNTSAFVYTDKEHNQCTYFHWGASFKFPELVPPNVNFVHLATADPIFNSKIAKITPFVSFDPGQDLVLYSKKDLRSILENTNILFTNRHEIKRVCEILEVDITHIKNLVDILIITYDSKGSTIYNKNIEYKIPAIDVCAVDPTGAGDAYRAGFLVAYQKGYPLDKCGKVGSTVASFAVESVGCQTSLPTWAQMVERFQLHYEPINE
ncbi:carbohydrate kinase family protein [Methanosalsum natronophilum]|uniref:Carbohydrate kinase family protein n=1 Tax=Methanosalsum natronophilum TaxID=768733 RepID=A0A424YQI0_9EURY|nr:carbohydrate kinase family protein [Methanosalsum natronophilum]MCS3923257.1 ribokinase [Methanosalsum natronophilum]RQD81231.1 MAG: carbohydrate kinase family protein [Methanosalsum natronophilum]